jgi:hypothetical protein
MRIASPTGTSPEAIIVLSASVRAIPTALVRYNSTSIFIEMVKGGGKSRYTVGWQNTHYLVFRISMCTTNVISCTKHIFECIQCIRDNEALDTLDKAIFIHVPTLLARWWR